MKHKYIYIVMKIFQRFEQMQHGLSFRTIVLLLSVIFLIQGAYADVTNAEAKSAKSRPDKNRPDVSENYDIHPTKLIPLQDGGYLITGYFFDDTGPSSWGWVAKKNKNGVIEWQRELGKKARDSDFKNATVTADGIVAVGRINGRPGGVLESSAAWIVKLDKQGDVLWDKSMRLADVTIATDVKPAGTEKMVVAGRLRKHILNADQDSAFIINIDSKGKIVWKKVLQTRYEAWADVVIQRHNGGFFVAGYSHPKFNHNGTNVWVGTDVWVAQLDESGNMLWEKNIESQGNEFATVLYEISDGTILVGAEYSDAGKESMRLTKLKADGNMIWEKKISGHSFCSIGGLQVTKSGEILAAGKTCAGSKEQIWAAIFSASGEIKESKKFAGSGRDFSLVDAAIEALSYLRNKYPDAEAPMLEVKL